MRSSNKNDMLYVEFGFNEAKVIGQNHILKLFQHLELF